MVRASGCASLSAKGEMWKLKQPEISVHLILEFVYGPQQGVVDTVVDDGRPTLRYSYLKEWLLLST